MFYIVHTQYLENYGAHAESGKFSDGKSYWKYKFGSTYVVDGLDREADAVAFVMSAFSQNNVGIKEYPCKVQSFKEWFESSKDTDFNPMEDWEREKKLAYYVHPETGRKTMPFSEFEEIEENTMAVIDAMMGNN